MALTVSVQQDLVAKERLVTIELDKDLGILLEDEEIIPELKDALDKRLDFFIKLLPVVQNKIGIVTDLSETDHDLSRILRAFVATVLCDRLFYELGDLPLWYEGADTLARETWRRYRINEGSTLYDVKDLLYNLVKRKSKDSVSMALEICLGEYVHRNDRDYRATLYHIQNLELPSEALLELLVMRRIHEEA